MTKWGLLVDLSVQLVQAGRAVARLVGVVVGELDMFLMVDNVMGSSAERVTYIQYSGHVSTVGFAL